MSDNGNMMSMVSEFPIFCYLELKGNPGPWIENNTPGPAYRILVKHLHLDFKGMEDDEELQIGESIGNPSELTELNINGAEFLECLPKAIATLDKLKKLVFVYCIDLLENFDILRFSLTCLKLRDCEIMSVPNRTASKFGTIEETYSFLPQVL